MTGTTVQTTQLPLLPLSDLEKAAWLKERRTGLGSSDAAAVAGLSPYMTPLHCYLNKKGLWESPQDERKMWGLLLEEVIATAYEEETTRRTAVPDQRVMRHPKYPWMLASLDRVVEVGGKPQVLEIKNVGAPGEDWGQSGTDEVPVHYHIQCQHQLAVTGWDVAELAALFSGCQLRLYVIPRDERIIASLFRMEAEFWDLVVAGREPAPNWTHPATLALIRGRYGVRSDLTVELSQQFVHVARLYQDCRAQSASYARDADGFQSQILAAMGEAGVATLPDGTRVERRLVRRKGYTVESAEYVRMRVRPPSA